MTHSEVHENIDGRWNSMKQDTTGNYDVTDIS